jgi:hypothetical protein
MKTLLIALSAGILCAGLVRARERGDVVAADPPLPAEVGEHDPPPPPPFRRPGMRGRRGERGEHGRFPALQRGAERAMEWLRREHPEKFERLVQMRRENPREFHEHMRNVLREYFRQQHPELMAHAEEQREQEHELQTLAAKYRETQTEEERAVVKSEMRGLLEKSFDQRQKVRKAELKKLEERIDEFRATLKAREENKKQMIEMRLKGLIDGEASVAW